MYRSTVNTGCELMRWLDAEHDDGVQSETPDEPGVDKQHVMELLRQFRAELRRAHERGQYPKRDTPAAHE